MLHSISKVFTMAKVIEEQGPEAIANTIGVDATGMRFNSVVSIEFSGLPLLIGTRPWLS